MFLNKISVPHQMLRARANGKTFLSATMCPRLPGPIELIGVACLVVLMRIKALENEDILLRTHCCP